MVQTYGEIGRLIVEEEQQGKARAGYGDYLIRELSQRLQLSLAKALLNRVYAITVYFILLSQFAPQCGAN